MNARQHALMKNITQRLQPIGRELIHEGWRPELVVLTDYEIPRIPGYKVCLVVPLDHCPVEPENSDPHGPRHQ